MRLVWTSIALAVAYVSGTDAVRFRPEEVTVKAGLKYGSDHVKDANLGRSNPDEASLPETDAEHGKRTAPKDWVNKMGTFQEGDDIEFRTTDQRKWLADDPTPPVDDVSHSWVDNDDNPYGFKRRESQYDFKHKAVNVFDPEGENSSRMASTGLPDATDPASDASYDSFEPNTAKGKSLFSTGNFYQHSSAALSAVKKVMGPSYAERHSVPDEINVLGDFHTSRGKDSLNGDWESEVPANGLVDSTQTESTDPKVTAASQTHLHTATHGADPDRDMASKDFNHVMLNNPSNDDGMHQYEGTEFNNGQYGHGRGVDTSLPSEETPFDPAQPFHDGFAPAPAHPDETAPVLKWGVLQNPAEPAGPAGQNFASDQ